MNDSYPSQRLEKAVDQLSQLPGIGRKTALRLALNILRRPEAFARTLGNAIIDLRERTCYCTRCHNISDTPICRICSDSMRDSATVLVVENIRDVMAFERTGGFKGFYHVLGGVISPIDGISPSDLEIESLVLRVEEEDIREIILAISPTPEGETTNFYIYRKLPVERITVTRLSRGIAVGDELEYADEITLAQALKDRSEFRISS